MKNLLLFSWLAAIILFCGCTRYRNFSIWRLTSSDRQIWRSFKGMAEQPTIFYMRAGDRVLRGWEIGADSLPITLLVHGSPSSMVKYQRWFSDTSFFRKTKLVAVDRPGYGKSGYGRSVASIARQAELLAPVVEKLSQRGPIVLYGSSYGGSVAARLAMNHPGKIKALVLQSASVQPNAERTPKIARVIRSPAGLVFPKWARVATREKFAHSRALEDIQEGWSRIECPVWILHGGMDKLIYPSNAEHAYQQLYPHTEVHYTCLDSLGHRIYWQKSDTIRHFILEALRYPGK